MNPHYTYVAILGAAIAGPLALSFDKKVAFYTKWRYVFAAMILPALFYIGWDMIFTQVGVWHFNPAYTQGTKLYNLPVEEVLFFFIVPYCCTFIYECIRCHFPKLQSGKVSTRIMTMLAFSMFILAAIFFNRLYTFYTCIFTGAFVLLYLCRLRYFASFNAMAFLVSYIVILLPFLAVNGILTALPVVVYNDAENTGLRIFTIPAEDVFYGLLLVMMNIVIFEKLRSQPSLKHTHGIREDA